MQRFFLAVTAIALWGLGGCSAAPSDIAEATPAITVETMDPLTGQVVGSREGHGAHGYETPPIESLGGAFQLVEATKGRVFGEADLKGSWTLVYFGYMECLEACPIALKSIPAAVDQLKAGGLPVKAVFVDINAPRLDDMTGGIGHAGHAAGVTTIANHHGAHEMTGPEIRREAIATWGPSVAPDMIFLSGTRKELAVATRAFQSRVEAAMLKNDEPIHHINHTTNIYVLDPQGRMAGVMYHSDPVKVMVETVEKLSRDRPAMGDALELKPAAPSTAPAGHAHGQ